MAEITMLDNAGIALIAGFEGCILHPYRDCTGVPTIGIGLTYYPESGRKVTMEDAPFTCVDEAYKQFALMVQPVCHSVRAITRNDLNQHQFNALISFAYNVGLGGYNGSTVHRLVNAGVSGEELHNAFLLSCKADGKVVQDLRARREKEYQTYIS